MRKARLPTWKGAYDECLSHTVATDAVTGDHPLVVAGAILVGTRAGVVVLASAIFSVLLVTMLAFHKCGHRARQPRWIRLLQKSGLLLSLSHHSQHHLGNYDFNYCLINGWADQTLGRLGLFRGLEWVIARWSGDQPQRNDHEWLRLFGRKVMGREGV